MCACNGGGNRNAAALNQNPVRTVATNIQTRSINAPSPAISPLALQAMKTNMQVPTATTDPKGMTKERRELERKRRSAIAQRLLGRR